MKPLSLTASITPSWLPDARRRDEEAQGREEHPDRQGAAEGGNPRLERASGLSCHFFLLEKSVVIARSGGSPVVLQRRTDFSVPSTCTPSWTTGGAV